MSRSGRRDSGDGGYAARRAVAKWAWRLFRREWRGQVLVLALLTVAVAAAVGGATAAYNLAPVGDAQFGSANHLVELNEPDPGALPDDIAAAAARFGTVDVISRRTVPVPGSFDGLEVRAQDPRGPFSAPMLKLLDGRFPVRSGEVAVTDGTAGTLDASVGARLDLGNGLWTVVGSVENPSDLQDEFALVAPSHIGLAETVTMLVGGSNEDLDSFHVPSGAPVSGASRLGNEDTLAAGGVLVAATLVLVLVALVAAAGFVVLAHRRIRQLGMLAAVGATERHVRLAMLANGAVIGALAAFLGSAVGLVTWIVIAPQLEPVVGHRIDALDVPWWLVATGMVLAVVCATGAAWWPARMMARIPIVSALSGRPPRARSAHRSGVVAGASLLVGIGCLVVAPDPLESWLGVALLLGGTLSLIVGVLLVSPLAIRALAGLRANASIATRLALVDLVRYQARSGAALAAMSLALGIAATIVLTSSSAVYASAAEGNLSEQQLMVRIGEIPGQGDVPPIPERTAAEVQRLAAVVDAIASSLTDATVTGIDVALAPAIDGLEGLPSVVLAEELGNGGGDGATYHRIRSQLYVASAQLLEHYELDMDTVGEETEILTVLTGELWFQPEQPAGKRQAEPITNLQSLLPSYSSLPGSFIMPAALERNGWATSRVAWLIEAAAPVTDEQLAAARDAAADAGATVEARHDQANLVALRTVATVAGIVLSLAIMAMAVGLIRSEAAGDLRILAAAGATSRSRRTLTGATAGALALLGALLGTGGAYLGVGAAAAGDLGRLLPVPVIHLLAIVVGLPALAATVSWLAAGTEPGGLARQPID